MATDRVFGLVGAALFIVIGALLYWRTGQFAWWLIAAAVALAACAFGAPSVLSPLNRAWIGFRQLVSRVASLILIVVIYWLAIVPAGLITRLFGRDRLALGFDKGASTYWSRRSSERVDMKNTL